MHTRASHTYSLAVLAVTYPYYEFPEFPWPDALIQNHHGAVTPPASAVQQYIEVLLAGAATPATVLMSLNLSACRCTPSSFNWSPASVSRLLSQSCGRQQVLSAKDATAWLHTCMLLNAALTLMIKPGQPAMPERSAVSRPLDGKQQLLYLLDV